MAFMMKPQKISSFACFSVASSGSLALQGSAFAPLASKQREEALQVVAQRGLLACTTDKPCSISRQILRTCIPSLNFNLGNLTDSPVVPKQSLLPKEKGSKVNLPTCAEQAVAKRPREERKDDRSISMSLFESLLNLQIGSA